MDNGDSCDVNMELEGNGAMDIYDDAFVITYLQASEVLIRLTPKKRNHVVQRARQFKWERNPPYGCGQMDKYKLCFAHNNMKTL